MHRRVVANRILSRPIGRGRNGCKDTEEANGRMPESSPTSDAILDVGHEGCGTLLVAIRQQMKELATGAVLEVIGYDPGAREDLPAWCRMTRNELIGTTGDLRRDEPIHYFIRKNG